MTKRIGGYLPRLCILLFILLPASIAFGEFKPNVQKKVLDNGLKVLVLEDPSSAVVSVQVWYHVGSKNEVPGKRGLAHMFEHLMFRGTKLVGPNEYSNRVKAIGGTLNAFTNDDLTAYHQTLPKEKLELALSLEADRMINLLLTQKHLDSEREVVKEEKRLRYDNSPIGATVLELRKNAYTKHPYQWTAIGTIEDLDSVTLDEAKAFYKKWYRPNNATLVIAGGVEGNKGFELVQKHFGDLEKGPTVDRTFPREPTQRKGRSVRVQRPAQLPAMIGGYHIPPIRDKDFPALEVLELILSSGDSSRMHETLVKEQKLAVSAGGFTWAMEEPGLFAIWAMYLPTIDSAKVQAALLNEVKRITQKGVSERELTKAKNQLTAGYIFGLQTANGLAMQLGYAELLEGGYERFLEGPKKYDGVTVGDIKRVARKYLHKRNLTWVTLVPGNKS